MRSSFGSKKSPSFFIAWTLFRSAKRISTTMWRGLSSDGRESSRPINHSGSSYICRRQKLLRRKLMNSVQLSLNILTVAPESLRSILTSSFASADQRWPLASRHFLSHHRPNSSQPCAGSDRACHRRELACFRMGRELEANRNISVRLVADRSTAQSVSTTFGGACEVKAVQEWRLPKAASRS